MFRCLVLIGCSLAGQMAAFGGEDLNAEVRRLVRQLDAPQLAQREAAEAELLRRGPAVLDLLPPATDRSSAEVQQRMGRIRQQLQLLAADAVTKTSTITLHVTAMPLTKILAAFCEQSGNRIDYDLPREPVARPSAEPKLNVNFNATPFWPALDKLMDQAGLVVRPRVGQAALDVVAAPAGKLTARSNRASYSGPFRFEPVALLVRHGPGQADGGLLTVTLEAAWEPRLRVIGLVQRLADVCATDERGDSLPAADPQAQREALVDGHATVAKFDLPLQLPPHRVQRIANLKGKLSATILGRIETFRFRKLADAKNVQQRIAGVTVTLEQVRKSSPRPLGEGQGVRAGSRESRPHPSPLPAGDGTCWEVRIAVRFDDAGDALASHRQWIFDNSAYLEGVDGKPIAYQSFETTAQDKNEVGLAYQFSTDRPLGELTFIYKTPGTIVTRSFDYELKDIKLP